jgi:hypothetical protein
LADETPYSEPDCDPEGLRLDTTPSYVPEKYVVENEGVDEPYAYVDLGL